MKVVILAGGLGPGSADKVSKLRSKSMISIGRRIATVCFHIVDNQSRGNIDVL